MQDHKMAAAGDQQEETSQRKTSETGESVTQEYLLSLIHWLETFTNKRLSESDTQLWMERLSRYPRWKLTQMGDYTGPLTNEVFKYLDGLRQSEPAFKSLPEPDPTPRSIQIARDFNEHIQAVMNFQGTSEERLKWEKESFLKLDRKWPHLAVWDKVKGEKRFQEVI